MRLLLFLLALPFLSLRSTAQQPASQDTVLLWRLPETEVVGTQIWTNDTSRYRYNQLRHYVQTILPYLTAATATVSEMDAKLNGGLRGAERRRYIAAKDRVLREQFEDRVKSLNVTQGVLLIKLIGRQTGSDLYSLLREAKGGVTALKWQTWARFHGINLARPYDPAAEPLLERVMRSLGYELPAFYAQAE